MTDNSANPTVRVCKICGRTFPVGIEKCPEDGGELVRPERDSLLGTVFLGKYEVLSILGEGGMSIVYKARHIHMEKVMALKLLNRELTNDEVAKERFRREASAASSLSHQNVVVVHDFGFTGSEKDVQAYLVMDCLEGVSLSDLIESRGSLEVGRAIEIFKQGLDGLEHAHKKGIIHRDIKPSNLVVIPEDDGADLVKLVDFGIAKASPQQGEKQRQQLTQTGEIFGSPLYMSPEQCNGRSIDLRSDIYSFGCLMYETLAGLPPLIGDTYINTVVKHLQEQPPPFSKTAPSLQLPAPVEAVIMKCLEKNPDNRYASVAELRQALLDAALVSGIKGYRAGAVAEVVRPSHLAQTFDRVRLAATGTFKKGAQNKSLVVPTLILLVILAGLGALSLVPYGPPGIDRLSGYDRIVFPHLLNVLSENLEKGNTAEAARIGKQAEAMARTFDDSGDRLEKVLRAEWRVALAAGNSTDQDLFRNEIKELVTKSILRDYRVQQSHLSKYETPMVSVAEKPNRQKEVVGSASAVFDTATRLHSRERHSEEQQLLSQAIRVYETAGLEADPKVADFKLQLGKCFADLQRFDEAKKLYEDAVLIRRNIEHRNASDNKLLSKALFALGSLDRDQSKFPEADKELTEAIKIAREEVKDDRLLLENLRAYLDLITQTKNNGKAVVDEEHAKVLVDEVTRLEKSVGPVSSGSQDAGSEI